MLILFHHTLWGAPLELPSSMPSGWDVTTDRSRLDEACAVVFHVPEWRFYDRPQKRPGQLWVAWSIESDANYPRLRNAEFMARFDLTMTYRHDADVLCGYVPYYRSADNLERALLAAVSPKDADRPVAMLISSRIDRSGRRAYARALARHIPISSYGRFMRNRSLPVDVGRSTKLDLIARHPFTIAFENSIAEDYVTEKFYDPLVAGSVPIYMGAPNVADFAPGDHCYVDTRDFPSPDALAGHLHDLLRNPVAYGELLAWKRQPLRPAFREFLDAQRTHPVIRLCRAIEEQLRARSELIHV
jgi:hypothetical protein